MFAINRYKIIKSLNFRKNNRNLSIQPIPKDPKNSQKQENNYYDEEFTEFKLKQLEFQKNDQIPTHLKCGLRDKLLMYFTLGLAFFGLTNTIGFIYNMAVSKKNLN